MTKKTVRIISDKCKGCMLCAEFCPNKAIVLSQAINPKGNRYVILEFPDKCTGCGMCAVMCPDCAIEIVSGN
ncbi:MAG TPA: 4Fe-4S binding protein [Candidatus Omnitrophota bacterium]|nr:4Fe-4S binding protein [Candidatus Omnitrophota bacterium]HPS19786.1 4Fe-4S binding protein [Candidatus Omnitrophota bacterium]